MTDPYPFPWKANGDFTTVVYIKNETNSTRKYTAHLSYTGGAYSLGMKELKAGQTVEIDFRKLRDDQTPGDRGEVIPPNIDVGQIAWSAHGIEMKTMSGRSEQISLGNGVASTYACANPCPNVIDQVSVEPIEFNMAVGDTEQLVGWQTELNSYGQSFGPYISQTVTWQTIDTGVATTGVSDLEAVSPGTTNLQGTFERYIYINWGGYCEPFPDNRQAEAPVEVAPTVTLTTIKAVGVNETSKIRVTIQNPNNRTISLTMNPKSGGSGAAKFVGTGGTNSNTRTITATGDVDISGVTASSAKNMMRLEASYIKPNNQNVILGTTDFTVLNVSLSLRYANTDTVSSDNAAKSTYQSAVGTFNLGGPRQRVGVPEFWGHGIEIVGTILPDDFDESLRLERVFNGRIHGDQNQISNYLGCADTSDPSLLDQDPQSGGSGGKIYDLDMPGIGLGSNTGAGAKLRTRTNFTQWASITQMHGATSSSVRVSGNISWFQRLSIIKNSGPGTSVLSDVANDNIVGAGSTNLTWNLAFAQPDLNGDPCP